MKKRRIQSLRLLNGIGFALFWVRYNQPTLMTCVDEAQKIKNRKTQTYQACLSLKSTMRWCLSGKLLLYSKETGTPIQNDLEEFFSFISFLRYPFYKDFMFVSPYIQFLGLIPLTFFFLTRLDARMLHEPRLQRFQTIFYCAEQKMCLSTISPLLICQRKHTMRSLLRSQKKNKEFMIKSTNYTEMILGFSCIVFMFRDTILLQPPC